MWVVNFLLTLKKEENYSLGNLQVACYVKFVVVFSYVIKIIIVGRDSAVSIAICCGLDGPKIESQWGQDFLHTARLTLGPTQPPIQWEPGLSQGVKQSGHGINHLSPFSAKIKERVSYTSIHL